MIINPPEHKPKDGLGREGCICGTTWPVQVILNGKKTTMEAHSSASSIVAVMGQNPPYTLMYEDKRERRLRELPPWDANVILEDGDEFAQVPPCGYGVK